MSAVHSLLAAGLGGWSAWLLSAPASEPRLALLLPRTATPPLRHARRALPVRLAFAAAAIGVLVVVGGVAGVVLAVVVVALGPRLVGRLESRADRSRREHLDRQAPLLADLLSATLASGAPMRAALAAAVAAVGDPMAHQVRPVLAALDLGADPESAFGPLTRVDALAPIAAAVVRSSRSGAALAQVLARIADDLRRQRQTRVEVAARSAGVSAVAPLAACFLPAFLLLGVVPVVVSLAGGLLA